MMKTKKLAKVPFEQAEEYYRDFNMYDAPLGLHFQVVTTYMSGYIQALRDYGILKPLSDEERETSS